MGTSKVTRKFPSHLYQAEALDAIEDAWKEYLKVLAVLPKGSGKTYVAGEIIARNTERGERSLMCVHTRKLCFQFAKATEENFGIWSTVEAGQDKSKESPLVCATVQSLVKRLRSGVIDPSQFSLVVLDESHRSLSESHQMIAKAFPHARILGITATPRRGDQQDLMKFFEAVAIDIPITRLIKEKFLAPLTIQNIPIKIELKSESKAGDYKRREIAHAIEPYLAEIADVYKQMAIGKCGLIFLPLIATSKKLLKLLLERGVRAEHVDGQIGDEAVNGAIRRLELGRTEVLLCSILLSEGVDIRPVNLLLNLRPTRSWTLYAQIIGRTTRTFDPLKHGLEGTIWPLKQDALILDPLWQCDQHNLLQRPATLFTATEGEAETLDRQIKRGGDAVDLMAAHTAVQHDREEVLRKRLAETAHRSSRLVNAIDFFMNCGREDLCESSSFDEDDTGEVAIQELRHRLHLEHNFDPDAITSRWQAGKILNLIREREKSGLAPGWMAKKAADLGMVDAWIRQFWEVRVFITKEEEALKPIKKPLTPEQVTVADTPILVLPTPAVISPLKEIIQRPLTKAEIDGCDRTIFDCSGKLQKNPKAAGLYIARGTAYEAKGELNKAIDDYSIAIQIKPKSQDYMKRGIAYSAKGDYDRAIADLKKGIGSDRRNTPLFVSRALTQCYTKRGISCVSKGDYHRAIADFNRAITCDPNDAMTSLAYSSLARLFATCSNADIRDAKLAVNHAMKACKLTEWKNPDLLDTLAAAFAEAGDFERAILWENKYLATAALDEEQADATRQRLALYEAHEACREVS